MPLTDVRLLEGVFSAEERRQLAEGLIDAVVAVKGEPFRSETEVVIGEVPVGNGYERGTMILPEGVGTGNGLEGRTIGVPAHAATGAQACARASSQPDALGWPHRMRFIGRDDHGQRESGGLGCLVMVVGAWPGCSRR